MISPYLQHRYSQIFNLIVAAFCLAFILSTGPQLQTYSLSLLNSDVASVYGSAHQQKLVEFPSLASWVAETFSWYMLLMGLIVAWFATRRVEPRVVAWSTAWSGAVILMVFDTVGALQSNLVNGKWLVENLVANLVGSALCAALLLGIFGAADFAHKHVPVGATGRRTLARAVVFVGGLLYCCVAYYVSGLFYAPLPANFEVSLSAPASGWITPKVAVVSSSPSNLDRPFSFTPEGANRTNVDWITPLGKVAVRANFDGDRLPRVEVRPVTGCTGAEQLQKLETGGDAWVAESNVSSFEIVGDAGMTDFMTVLPSTGAASIKLDTGTATMFQLDEEVNRKSIKITQFVGDAAALQIHRGIDIKFFLGMPLVASDSTKVMLAPRLVTLRIGGHTQFIRFWPPKNIRDVPAHLECGFLTDLKPLHIDSDGETDVQRSDAILGLMVIISQPADAKSMPTGGVQIRVNGAGGWITQTGLLPEDLRQQWLGRLSMLQVRGNVTDFSLDSLSQTPRQVESYTAVGDLQAQFSQGRLRVWGQAKRLWKDDARLNATKWEKLSWEPKLFVISLLFSAVGLLGTAIVRRLSANQKFSWMS